MGRGRSKDVPGSGVQRPVIGEGSPFLGCGRSEDTQSMRVFGDRGQGAPWLPSSPGSIALRQVWVTRTWAELF